MSDGITDFNRMVEKCKKYDALLKSCENLKLALIHFGRHKDDCGLSVIERCDIPEIIELGEQKFECPRICDCGLTEALSEAERL